MSEQGPRDLERMFAFPRGAPNRRAKIIAERKRKAIELADLVADVTDPVQFKELTTVPAKDGRGRVTEIGSANARALREAWESHTLEQFKEAMRR